MPHSEFISTSEAAKMLEITDRRIRVLCQQGRVIGAKKVGTTWIIPVGDTGIPEIIKGRLSRKNRPKTAKKGH